MKKVLLVLLGVFLLVGCGKSTTYDLSKVEKGVTSYYPDAEVITLERLGKKYDVDTSSIEEGLILMPKLASNADMLFVLKPKEKEKVKKEIDGLFDMFLTQYEMYYEEEYQKLKDKTVKEKDGYLIYIVSNESDQVLKAIEENH